MTRSEHALSALADLLDLAGEVARLAKELPPVPAAKDVGPAGRQVAREFARSLAPRATKSRQDAALTKRVDAARRNVERFAEALTDALDLVEELAD